DAGAASRPYATFACRDRFHRYTVGSTQTVARRSASSCSAPSATPPTSTEPSAGRCHPSSRPTSVDFPAPEGPTIATCSPSAISSSSTARISFPPPLTTTSLITIPVLVLVAVLASPSSGAPSGSTSRNVTFLCAGYCCTRN